MSFKGQITFERHGYLEEDVPVNVNITGLVVK